MPGPFDGIRIIDLTAMVSGPLATMTLADQGADVIKVEAPNGGDHARHVATRRGGFAAAFLNNNRNKRSIIIDLKSKDGLDVFLRLAKDADVVIQNFRPGVADRIGVGEDALRELNPRLIHVSISGFGFDGPYSQKPVFDPLIQAVSGLTTVQAGSDQERPRLVRTILPDKLTGIQTSQAISAALFARERSGEGQAIKISMLDTVVAFLWSSDMGSHTFVGIEPETERAQSFIDLIYETADGYASIAVMQDKEWRGLAKALNKPEFLEDERFKTTTLRGGKYKDDRMNLTQDAVRHFTTDELIAVLEAEDVPCAPVLTRRQMRHHPQIAANETLFETDHPTAGPIRQARQPAQFSKTPNEHRFGAPVYGEHTREILSEAGWADTDIDALEASGAVRQGSPDQPQDQSGAAE
ncbi:MAG: CoA transferase [Rhizobiales bacterium]|nr:CoA transferase [Hyphomicrobiales bacterium]